MRRVLTYGTYDLLHWGHIRLLKRAREQGDYLIVGLSTEHFNEQKGKKTYHNYVTRKRMLEAVRYVDLVIAENDWSQKNDDIDRYEVDVVIMGDDWKDDVRFKAIAKRCEMKFLPRTDDISTTKIKKDLGGM